MFLTLIFFSLLSFYVNADFLENLNITLKETIQYDELYSDGLYAYNLKDFCKAKTKFEQALSDYKYQENVKLHCREKCYNKFQGSLGNRNIHTVLEDLELEYFRLTIYSRRCTQKCNEKYLGRRSLVSAPIERDFEYRKLYSFLQFSYYKVRDYFRFSKYRNTGIEIVVLFVFSCRVFVIIFGQISIDWYYWSTCTSPRTVTVCCM